MRRSLVSDLLSKIAKAKRWLCTIWETYNVNWESPRQP
jgi:hypothetical protein